MSEKLGKYIGYLLGSVYDVESPALDYVLYSSEEFPWQQAARDAFYEGCFNRPKSDRLAHELHVANPTIRGEALRIIAELAGKDTEWDNSPQFQEGNLEQAQAYAQEINKYFSDKGVVTYAHYNWVYDHTSPYDNWYTIRLLVWSEDITPGEAVEIANGIVDKIAV